MRSETLDFEIDEHQIEAYRRDGFLTLPRLADDPEVAWLRGVYDKLFADYAVPETGDYRDIAGRDDAGEPAKLPQIIKPEKYAPELLDSAHFARCRAIASTFLDIPADELDFYGHAILKPPRYGAPTMAPGRGVHGPEVEVARAEHLDAAGRRHRGERVPAVHPGRPPEPRAAAPPHRPRRPDRS